MSRKVFKQYILPFEKRVYMITYNIIYKKKLTYINKFKGGERKCF